MKKRNRALKIFFIMLFFLSTSVMVQAEDQGIGYEIRPIFSNNQIDSDKGFYYVETKPGEKQEMQLSVLNTRDSDITVELGVENAVSQSEGNIGYTDKLDLLDESLKNPVSELVVPKEETVTIKAGEEKVVTFDLTPPKDSYAGIKMGRIVVKEKSEDDGKKGIDQKFQYALGVILSESGDMFNDGNQLAINSAKAVVSKGSKEVQGEIVNPEPKTIENLKVNSYVTKKGDSKKIKERQIENYTFAPSSKVAYAIPWGLSNFETGEYTFHFEAHNEFDSFNLTKDFKIRGEDAKKLNNESAFSVKTSNQMKMIIIGLNTLLVIICVIIFMRNKRWIKEIKIRKKKRGRKKRN